MASIDEIVNKFRELKMPGMADHISQLYSTDEFSKYSTLEIIEQLIDQEQVSRKNHTIERRLRQAGLTDSQARLEAIDYRAERNINQALIDQLKTNEYIIDGRNVLILGATGCGKTFLANALAVNACEDTYRVKYFRMIELLSNLSTARIEGNVGRLYKQYGNVSLLVIDDFLLTDTTPNEQKDLMEIFEYRGRGKSTVLCSQLSPEEWHSKLGASHIADAILDRITNNSYTIELKGDSLRRKV
ncbi:MAG: IS21-like element helper ATPase IstB [Erysipelotrichaceae bacterium]|nr:IS21-like element helper ATPase IstB [Erysipelotrichaceae bacterium]